MSRIEILQRQEHQEDTTPLSASSPRTTNAQSPRMSTAGKATLGYGLLIARQSYQTAVGEIQAQGNEQMAHEIQNATRMAGYGILTATLGAKALVPIAIREGTQAIQSRLEINRNNEITEVKNQLRGQRVRVGVGRD